MRTIYCAPVSDVDLPSRPTWWTIPRIKWAIVAILGIVMTVGVLSWVSHINKTTVENARRIYSRTR